MIPGDRDLPTLTSLLEAALTYDPSPRAAAFVHRHAHDDRDAALLTAMLGLDVVA